MKYLFLLGCCSLSALAQPTLAQVSAGDGSAGEIVVLASGFAQPRDSTGQAISVIDRAALDRLQSVTIADAVRGLPGVGVVQRGAVGGQTSVFLRGGNSSQTLVLIDGVRVNDPSSPNAAFDFGTLLAGNAERIEVLRGPNAIVWGSQALGGVVNIETAAPGATLAARGAMEYGYADSVLARANLSAGTERIAASLGGTFYRTDGISALAGGAEADGSRTWGLNGRVRVALAADLALDLRSTYGESRIAYDSPWSGGAEALPVANNRQFTGYAGLNLALAGGRWQNRLAYTRSDINRRGSDPVVFSYNNYQVSGTIDRIEYRSSVELGPLATASFGAEHEWISSSTSYEGDPAQLQQTEMTGGYLQLTLRPLAGLSLTGGVRHDDYTTYGGHTALGGNLAWSLNHGTTVLRATYGEGFRAPTLTEGQPPYGNPELKPETARNLDLGIEQSLLDRRVWLSATWYHRRSTNLIVYAPATFRSENVGQVDSDGLELALLLRPVPALRIEGSYTLTNAINRSGGFAGKRLQLRPQHSGSLALDWTSPLGLRLGTTVQLIGDSFDDQANRVPLDGFALVALRAALPLGERLELYGRVENLFDARYTVVAGYGTYGRAAHGGVRLQW